MRFDFLYKLSETHLNYKKNWARYKKKMCIDRDVRTRFSSQILGDLSFMERFSKNITISSFMEIRPVGAKLFVAGGLTDRHGEASSSFWQFCEIA